MLYKLAIKEVHLIVQNSTLWTHLILVLKYIQKAHHFKDHVIEIKEYIPIHP